MKNLFINMSFIVITNVVGLLFAPQRVIHKQNSGTKVIMLFTSMK